MRVSIQVSGVSCNLHIAHTLVWNFVLRRVGTHLVAQTLASDDGDFIADALVGLEVEGETRVVALDDDFGGAFDGLGTDATHGDVFCTSVLSCIVRSTFLMGRWRWIPESSCGADRQLESVLWASLTEE